MKILITGASSYVGARLFFDLKKEYELIGTYFSNRLSEEFVELNVTDGSAVLDIIEKHKPDIVLHVAANASAAWCEEHPKEAIAINEKSTTYLIETAKKIKAVFILMSSYAVHDPSTLYARTKINSEKIVKESGLEYLILRPSLIVGLSPNTTNDRPMNRLLKNLDGGTPAVYDTSWKFYPTYLRHISEIIDLCIKRNIKDRIIPIAVNKVVSRYELAKDILEPFGVRVTSEDKGSTASLTSDNLEILKQLDLPKYKYGQMIKETVNELKNRDKFRL